MPIKINKLEIENVKRVKAVKIEPTANGLTIVGGNNNQGKTSILDAIAWGLGGNQYHPSQATRIGSTIPPFLRIVLSNGLIVERKGKNSTLKVTDPSGKKAGQQLLNEFVSQFALDLPKFMEGSGKEKAKILLKIIGVEEKLSELEKKEIELYNERQAIGRIADRKMKFAQEQPFYPNTPNDLISPMELIQKQQSILAKNGENKKKRDHALELHAERNRLAEKINFLKEELENYQKKLIQVDHDMIIAQKTIEELHDESTAEIEASIANIEEINRKVRANLDKEKAENDAKEYRKQYEGLTEKIEKIRKAKTNLLQNADLPLPELTVSNGELVYKGQRWDNISGSDRLKISTAIVRRLNPKCGFVLLDKLEQMDLNTLNNFGKWLEQEDLQAIATRVSSGDECSIIIEDGYVMDRKEQKPKPIWKKGEF